MPTEARGMPTQRDVHSPLLRLCAERDTMTFAEAFRLLRGYFEITEKEFEERVPSGERRFHDRIRWAKTYLVGAGLLEGVSRGVFRITELGNRALDSGENINEYIRMLSSSSVEESESSVQNFEAASDGTPDEILRAAHDEITAALASELLEEVLSSSPAFFERLIVKLLLAMSYGSGLEDAGRVLGRSGDGGVDGVINQDPLGVNRIYVQAKRYSGDNSVGPDAINSFSGALKRKKSSKGIFFTTSSFTSGAVEAAKDLGIALVDGRKLAQLMIHYGLGCRVSQKLEIKRLDENFFSED